MARTIARAVHARESRHPLSIQPEGLVGLFHLVNRGWSEAELRTLWRRVMAGSCGFIPDAIIFLRANPDVLYERLHRRERAVNANAAPRSAYLRFTKKRLEIQEVLAAELEEAGKDVIQLDTTDMASAGEQARRFARRAFEGLGRGT